MSGKDRIFGLPQVPEADFNRLSTTLPDMDPLIWVDSNKNKSMEPEEIHAQSSEILSKYISRDNGAAQFTAQFSSGYKIISEIYRQEKVLKELSLTYMEPVLTDLGMWLKKNVNASEEEIVNYKMGTAELLKVAELMQVLYEKQVGYAEKLKDEGKTPADYELISRYGHPFCIGDQSEFCIALPSLPERGNGVYPPDVTCEQASGGMMSLGNPFSVVVRDEKGYLVTKPYALEYKDDLLAAAKRLKKAAINFIKIPREREFARHLVSLAAAFESEKPFPYVESDATWHTHGESTSVFVFRAGADEVGGDGIGDNCVTKARFHLRLGLINPESSKLVEKYKPYLQKWENKYAELVGNKNLYQSQDVALKLPQFYDVIYEVGDDVGGPNGTSIGQTLPNWCGEDGMETPCKRRLMIYVNKTEKAYSDQLMKKYIMPLFSPEHSADFVARGVGLDSVVLHEISHNLGPQPGKPKPGVGTTYEEALGKWRSTMEELKAQTGSMLAAGELLKEARENFQAGKIGEKEMETAEKDYRRHIIYDLAWAMRMILRATRGGKFEGSSYSRLAAIQVGVLTELGALSFNKDTRQWTINFAGDRFMKDVERLQRKVVTLYSEGDYKHVDEFVTRYISGEGFQLLHSDRIVEVAGNMPSVLFDYEIQDLN